MHREIFYFGSSKKYQLLFEIIKVWQWETLAISFFFLKPCAGSPEFP
jgi:hypothetical protein